MSKFPYKYGSDLHFLWGWGERLRIWLAKDHPPSESVRLIFRPDRGARDAMMRLSVRYPIVIKAVSDSLDFTERQFSRFAEEGRGLAGDDFVCAVGTLRSRINTAAETISRAEDDRDHTEAPVQVSLERGEIVVDGKTHDAPSHWCRIVNLLVENVGDYVTGPQMRDLPGCAGKKISREITALEKAIPAIGTYLRHEGNRGYRLLFR